MPVLQYNPIQDAFTTYETVETPKVTLNFPLSDSPVDISDWSIGIGSSGIPIAKPAIERPHMVTSDVIAPFHNTPTDSAQASASDSVKGSSVPNERAQQAYQFFLNNGFSNYAAAGIVGNLYHESGGLNTREQPEMLFVEVSKTSKLVLKAWTNKGKNFKSIDELKKYTKR